MVSLMNDLPEAHTILGMLQSLQHSDIPNSSPSHTLVQRFIIIFMVLLTSPIFILFFFYQFKPYEVKYYAQPHSIYPEYYGTFTRFVQTHFITFHFKIMQTDKCQIMYCDIPCSKCSRTAPFLNLIVRNTKQLV